MKEYVISITTLIVIYILGAIGSSLLAKLYFKLALLVFIPCFILSFVLLYYMHKVLFEEDK